MNRLIDPHGGILCDLMANNNEQETLKLEAVHFTEHILSERQLCDVELLLNGAFSPLTGFMGQKDYQSVLTGSRLLDGTLWPIPITLDVTQATADKLKINSRLALRDQEGLLIAVLTVEDIFSPDRIIEAQQVYGTDDIKHPAVNYLFNTSEPVYVGGTLTGIEIPPHYDYQLLRHSPRELRDQFKKMGWSKVVAFQTRNPLHRAHKELTLRAAKEVEGNLLIQPVVGLTKPGDVDHYTRVRCYQKTMPQYPTGTAMLSLLPLAMRMGGDC